MGPPESKSQTASRSVLPFLHSSRQSVPVLYNGPSFTVKIAPSHGGLDPIEYTIPWVYQSSQPTQHLDWISCFRTAQRRLSLYFTMGRPFDPQNCPFSWRDGPHLIIVPHIHPSPQPKRHLDRLSRFCRAHYCDRPTDRPTNTPRYSVGNNRPYLRRLRPNNTCPKINFP